MRPREVDVRIHVAQGERARGAEHRAAAVQAGIAGAGDRSPAAARSIDEDHVVELVDRFEAQNQRRPVRAVRESRLRPARPRGNAPCRGGRPGGSCAASRAGRRLVVVRQVVEKALDVRRRAQAPDQRCSAVVNAERDGASAARNEPPHPGDDARARRSPPRTTLSPRRAVSWRGVWKRTARVCERDGETARAWRSLYRGLGAGERAS